MTAINLDKWRSLDADTQALIESEIASGFEDPAWAVAQDALANDIACLTGNGACPAGPARDMVLVEASEAEFARARKILVEQVLPDWADRAGADWAARWNDSVGAVVGVAVPVE